MVPFSLPLPLAFLADATGVETWVVRLDVPAETPEEAMITPLPLPRPLTPEEQRLLFRFCREHPIAQCQSCRGDYTMAELGSDLFGTRFNLCRSCRVPLTDSIREHLALCTRLRN
jgi:hypothetical protein